MKTKLILLSLLFISKLLLSQNTEFPVYKNGLIYNEYTMNKLETIVDSLNLKYKSCDLNKTYYSLSQGKGTFVRLKEGVFRTVKKDIEGGMDLDAFIKKYPDAKLEKDILVIRHEYESYTGDIITELSEIELEGNYGAKIRYQNLSSKEKAKLKGPWYYKEYKNEIEAFYIPEDLNSQPLSNTYGRMIGYADCLIDTTVQKFRENAREGWLQMPPNWQELTLAEKSQLLEDLRNTIVVGSCSQDNSPRYHALFISILSAETTNWEVFLRSHLDIMNDRFERASDGSYAWAKRQTYIRELEELEINMLDLIFGITLRIDNSAENHYYGSVRRIGRALSESRDQELVEQGILQMIQDDQLDDYNRVLAYFLFENYLYYFNDKNLAKAKEKDLQAAIKTLPSYLREKIKVRNKY